MLTFPALSVPLQDLHGLLRPVEPVASVYLSRGPDLPADPEWAAVLRRRRIAKHLGEQGASNPTIDAIVGHLARMPDDTMEYAVFARDGRVCLALPMPGSATTLSAYAAPAKVAPLLAWCQQQAAPEPWDQVDVAGERATIQALAEGRVRRLVIVDDPGTYRSGWFAPDLLCALEEAAPYAQRGRLTDIAIRAAVLMDASVTVLTPLEGARLPDGMGVLLDR